MKLKFKKKINIKTLQLRHFDIIQIKCLRKLLKIILINVNKSKSN